jgi:transposase InsO family protein
MALKPEQKMEVALFRFSLIAPLLNNQIEDAHAYLEMISSKPHDVPHYGRREYSAKTIRTWLSSYRQGGLDSLLPAVRKDKGIPRSIAPALGEKLLELRRDHPEYSVQLFYDQMVRQGILLGCETSYYSVYRFLKKHGLHKMYPETKSSQKDRKKFAYDQVNRLWQGDMMAGPYLYRDGKKKATYLFAFIDDCSRIIPYARFDTSQNFNAMKSVFIEALLRRGIPQVVYLDNAKVYRSKLFHEASARLGITVAHAEVYDAASKGKIERFFRTVRERFLLLLPYPLTSLEQLNESFFLWLEEDYHRKEHSALGMSPLNKYLSQINQLKLAPDPDNIHHFFLQTDKRRVNNDATISISGRFFEVPSHLIGQRLTVRFDPDNLAAVWLYLDDELLGQANPVIPADNAVIKRQQHILSFKDAMAGKEAP